MRLLNKYKTSICQSGKKHNACEHAIQEHTQLIVFH